MKKFLSCLMFALGISSMAQADEVTLNFADLGLDDSATLTDYKINDNLSISSTGNSRWVSSGPDFRLFAGGGFNITVKDATLTGVAITCTSGRGFAAWSTVTVDSETTTDFTADPFSWTGSASESWAISAAAANVNVRTQSITLTYTPKAVSETLTAEVLCKDMNVGDSESLPATGYDLNEYVNVNFLQGSHSATPTYRPSAEAFYIFNGQQVSVTANKGAKLEKIEISTAASNTFGYSGSVTADDLAQTYETDYTWVPCVWHGEAEQSVVFTNGGKTGNTRVTGIKVTYMTPGEGLTVAKPEISQSADNNSISIICETEGAKIYYTLDDSEPSDTTGTEYTEAFDITEPCTVKAIAILNGVASSVATLDVYLRIVESLSSFISNASPEAALIECPVTAIETVGSYLMVKDDKGSFAMVRNINPDLSESLNVENGTTWANMTAQFDPYGDYGYIQPTALGEVSEGEPVVPKDVTVAAFDCVPFEYVSLKGVAIEKEGYNTLLFKDTDGEILYGMNRFVVTLPDLSTTDSKVKRYDVTGFASNDGEELWPVTFKEDPNAGIESAIADQETAIYFNIQGIRVSKPESEGVYIVVKGNKTEKLVMR